MGYSGWLVAGKGSWGSGQRLCRQYLLPFPTTNSCKQRQTALSTAGIAAMKSSSGWSRSYPPGLLHGSMLISAFLVATSFTVGKAITPFMDPVALTLLRFLIATLLFTPYVGYKFGLV